MQDGPKKQGDPVVLTVHVYNERKHEGTAKRPLIGIRRAAMGMFDNLIPALENSIFSAKQVSEMGALAVYERNMRSADEELLREGNYTEVPSMDVLKTPGQEYSNRNRLDEDVFRELRIFREMTYRLDQSSKEVKGEKNQLILMYRGRAKRD